MRAFRTLTILLMLLCLVPPLSLLAAGLIARWAGCELDLPPNTPFPAQSWAAITEMCFLPWQISAGTQSGRFPLSWRCWRDGLSSKS